MENLTENLSFDLGVVGQTMNNTNKTSRYFSMTGHRRAVAVVIGGAEAATKTTKIEWLQATDAAGTSSKAVASSSATGTSGTKDTAATISLGSVANTDTVTINSVVFTKAAANDTAAGEFADDDGLVLCIAASSIADQVSATAAGNVATLVAKDGYDITLSKAENAGTITLATTQSVTISEIDEEDLDVANSFEYVAAKVTNTGNGINAVMIVRDNKQVGVTQNAAATTAL